MGIAESLNKNEGSIDNVAGLVQSIYAEKEKKRQQDAIRKRLMGTKLVQSMRPSSEFAGPMPAEEQSYMRSPGELNMDELLGLGEDIGYTPGQSLQFAEGTMAQKAQAALAEQKRQEAASKPFVLGKGGKLIKPDGSVVADNPEIPKAPVQKTGWTLAKDGKGNPVTRRSGNSILYKYIETKDDGTATGREKFEGGGTVPKSKSSKMTPNELAELRKERGRLKSLVNGGLQKEYNKYKAKDENGNLYLPGDYQQAYDGELGSYKDRIKELDEMISGANDEADSPSQLYSIKDIRAAYPNLGHKSDDEIIRAYKNQGITVTK